MISIKIESCLSRCHRNFKHTFVCVIEYENYHRNLSFQTEAIINPREIKYKSRYAYHRIVIRIEQTQSSPIYLSPSLFIYVYIFLCA